MHLPPREGLFKSMKPISISLAALVLLHCCRGFAAGDRGLSESDFAAVSRAEASSVS
jgi:hypothetical protein